MITIAAAYKAIDCIASAYKAIDILLAENQRLRADLALVRNQRDEANTRATWKGMAP